MSIEIDFVWLWELILAFLVGICVGSFLNVVGLRFLADESINGPASHCPHCQTPLKPWDNIPLLSYLLLRGRCRSCKALISIQYPLIELITGLLYAGIIAQFGFQWSSLLLLFLVSNLIVILITDWKESLIFQVNSLALIPVGLVYSTFNWGHLAGAGPIHWGHWTLPVSNALLSALLAMGIIFLFFEGIILLSKRFLGTEGFGHGDTHLMMGAAAFLGWPLTGLALILGFIIQSIPAIPMLVIQWIQERRYLILISGIVGVLGSGAPLLLTQTGLTPEMKLLITMICLAIAIIALIVFMSQIKCSRSFTYLPLGPALIVGILLVLFKGSAILAAYQQFLLMR